MLTPKSSSGRDAHTLLFENRHYMMSKTPLVAQPNTSSTDVELLLYNDADRTSTSPWTVQDALNSSDGATAIEHHRLKAITRACLYLIPVGVSIAILQLNFRRVYWRAPDSSNDQQSLWTVPKILAALQIAAKAHEVIIVMSLAGMVLYYLRQLVASPDGLPFGLVTAAYRFAFGGIPFSGDFMHALTGFNLSKRWFLRSRVLALSILLFACTFIGLTAGPSSATILLPRLDWWDHDDMFRFYDSMNDFDGSKNGYQDLELYIPIPLFPREVDSLSLPSSSCVNATSNQVSACPYAGLYDLIPFMDVGSDPIENGTVGVNLKRPVLYSGTTFNSSTSSSATSITSYNTAMTFNQVLADYLYLGWAVDIASISGPYTINAHVNGVENIPQASVSTICNTQPAEAHQREWPTSSEFESQAIVLNQISAESIDVSTIFTADSLSNSSTTQIILRELGVTSVNSMPFNGSVLGAIILSSVDAASQPNVTLCTAVSSWTNVTAGISWPGTEQVITNFTSYNTYDPNNLPIYSPFNIRQSWADGFNAINPQTNSSILATFFDTATKQVLTPNLPSQVPVVAANQTNAITPNANYAHSGIILAAAISSGLSRIGVQYSPLAFAVTRTANWEFYNGNATIICRSSTGWCSQGPFIGSLRGPAAVNATWNAIAQDHYWYDYSDSPAMHSFPKPADADTLWTRLSFPVRLYGYGWNLDLTTSQLAAAVLIAHGVLVLVHCIVVAWTGKRYRFAGNLGDLLALALDSEPPKGIGHVSVKVGRGKTWGMQAGVRERAAYGDRGDGLGFVVLGSFDAGDDLKYDANSRSIPRVGKKYD